MFQAPFAYLRSYRSCALGVALCVLPTAAKAESPLELARSLVLELQPDRNSYAFDPSYILWPDASQGLRGENRSVCSTFYTLLLKKSYSLENEFFEEWLGRRSPVASNYYDAINRQDRFQSMEHVDEIKAGDVLAIKYLEEEAATTGHMGIVDSTPRLRISTSPLIPDTIQYELPIIDSALSGHGEGDTRYLGEENWDDGVGRGSLRIYTDLNGNLVGYTWSFFPNSQYYSIETHPIAVGRLIAPLKD